MPLVGVNESHKEFWIHHLDDWLVLDSDLRYLADASAFERVEFLLALVSHWIC
jgi:hypothetical protein